MSRVEKGGRSFRPIAKAAGLKKSPSASIAPTPSSSTPPSQLTSSRSASVVPKNLPSPNLPSPPPTQPIGSISQQASQPSSSASQPHPPATQAPRLVSQPPSRSPSSILPPTPPVTQPIASTSPPVASQTGSAQPSQPTPGFHTSGSPPPIASDHQPNAAPTPAKSTTPPSPRPGLTRSSVPLFNPASPPASLSGPDLHPAPTPPARSETPSAVRPARESSVLSTTSTGLSAAEKMKMKARAAKAARAAEKLKNPTPGRRSASVASERPTPVAGDIRVPSPPRGEQPLNGAEQTAVGRPLQMASPPIDPSLELPSLAPEIMAKRDALPDGCDIPVASTSERPYRELSAAPKDRQPRRTKKPTKRAPKTLVQAGEARPADRSGPSQDAHEAGSGAEEEDISPRLKRLRRLKQLREKKRKRAHGEPQSSEEEQGEPAAAKRPRARGRPRGQKGAKSKARGKRKKTDEQEGLESEGSDPDAPLDPHTMSMRDLCMPERDRGRPSAVLQERMKRVIERRDREKAERMAARAEERKRQVRPLARKREDCEDGAEDPADEPQPSDEDEEARVSESGENNAQEEAEKAKREMLERYGLEDLDSDDDMADFEEVDFDEFATSKNNKKTPTTVDQAKAPSKNAKSKTKMGSKAGKSETPEGFGTTQVMMEDDEEEIEEIDFVVPEPTGFAPQLRVVDGQIVLDQDSLQVDRQDSSARLEEMEIVEEDDSTRLVNSHTWGGNKFARSERWSGEETSMFYDAIRLFGSDFEMIAQLFPGRTRRQIRAKWVKEEKLRPCSLTDALTGRGARRRQTLTPISEAGHDCSSNEGEGMPGQVKDFEEYAKLVGIDCSAPIPVDPMDKWREKERLEDEEARKMACKEKEKTDAGGEEEGEEDGDEGWGEMELL